MSVDYLNFYKKKCFSFRLKHLIIVLGLAIPILALILPDEIEKIGNYGKTHIILKKTNPIFRFSTADTVLRRHIKIVEVKDNTCGKYHIHIKEAGSNVLKRVVVTDPSLYSVGEKIKIYRCYYPKEISIVEDRIPVNEVFYINGKKVKAFKIRKYK